MVIIKYFNVISKKYCILHQGDSKEYPESIYQMLLFAKKNIIHLKYPTENIVEGVLCSKAIIRVFSRSSFQETQRSLELPEGTILCLKLATFESVIYVLLYRMQELQGQRGLCWCSRKLRRTGNMWQILIPSKKAMKNYCVTL